MLQEDSNTNWAEMICRALIYTPAVRDWREYLKEIESYKDWEFSGQILLESDRFCNQETFLGFAACPCFQSSLTSGRALLIQDVFQLMTFL